MVNYDGSKDFLEVIKGRVLVDFYATWCGPCRMLSPVLELLEQIDAIEIVKVNVDEYPEIARKYGVMSIPCLILFDEGKEVKRNIGFLPLEKVKEFIQ